MRPVAFGSLLLLCGCTGAEPALPAVQATPRTTTPAPVARPSDAEMDQHPNCVSVSQSKYWALSASKQNRLALLRCTRDRWPLAVRRCVTAEYNAGFDCEGVTLSRLEYELDRLHAKYSQG